MAKLVWRVKLVTELQAGETTEVEVARLERDEQAGLADLGLGLAEAKRLTAAIQAEIVPAQVTIASENRRTCVACGRVLASKGHYTATFRSLFGDVPIRVREHAILWGSLRRQCGYFIAVCWAEAWIAMTEDVLEG